MMEENEPTGADPDGTIDVATGEEETIDTNKTEYAVGLDTLAWVRADSPEEAIELAAEKFQEMLTSGDPKVDCEFTILDQIE